jgi:hypothetical protein
VSHRLALYHADQGVPDWSTIDSCEAAATNPSNHSTAKWSLSIKIGADTPLWLYASSNPMVANSCTASPQSGETGPGSSTLKALQVNWQQSYEYTVGSTQCIPIPWDTDFQTKLNGFIRAASSHMHAMYPSHLPDHVVVTGINYFTQENVQPYCTVRHRLAESTVCIQTWTIG